MMITHAISCGGLHKTYSAHAVNMFSLVCLIFFWPECLAFVLAVNVTFMFQAGGGGQ